MLLRNMTVTGIIGSHPQAVRPVKKSLLPMAIIIIGMYGGEKNRLKIITLLFRVLCLNTDSSHFQSLTQ